jgi:hypothetical protein
MGVLILSTAVLIFLAAWLMVTILNQANRTRRWISKLSNYDVCGVIPIWTFFAPNPGNTDVHLLYRDRGRDGETTHWRDIQLERRNSALEFWNPRRRIGKGVVDVVPDLTANLSDEPRQSIDKRKVLEFPYLLVLNYVCHQSRDFRAETRQFAVARTRGFSTESDPDILFLSAFHRLT